jgi:2-hydroxychromene-2-carboxylate isomerase
MARRTAGSAMSRSSASPTLVLDGELFWGQDRLGFLDRALARRAAARN